VDTHNSRGNDLQPASCQHMLRLSRDFDQFEILAQEVVDEDGEIDAFCAGERSEAGLYGVVKIDRQVQPLSGAVELVAGAARKVDLSGKVVVVGGVHGVTYRGSFWYCSRSRRVAARAAVTIVDGNRGNP